ncbi:MAG TPA: DUF222 domain-containing protein [Acidimicrobiales bacterium]
MLSGLAEAIEELDVPVDRDTLRQLIALRDRLEAKVVVAVRDYDRSGLWACDGATSMTAWLRAEAGMSPGDAGRVAARAKRLARLPATAAAWADGELSTGQVDAVLASVTTKTIDRLADHEHDLLPTLASLPARDVARVMRVWHAHAEAEAGAEPPVDERERRLRLSAVGNEWAIDGTLDAEGGNVVATALRLATTPDAPGEPERTAPERRADALVDVCRYYLDHQTARRGGSRHRPHVNVVVDIDDLETARGGETIDGMTLGADTIGRLLCDSAVHRVVMAGGSAILDYGTSTRTIPVHLWNAIVIRDRHCRFPGCDRPPHWCEGHHVEHVEHGGPTAIDNLVLLCTRHHHLLHNQRWRAKLLPDATFEVTSPDGLTRATRPPGALPDLWSSTRPPPLP